MPALRAAPANLLTVGQSNAQVIGGGLNFFQGSTAATSDIPYLHWTPTYSGDRSTWTVSCWVKPSTDSSGYMPIFMATDDNFTWEYEGLFWFTNNLYYIDYISSAGGGTYNVLWRTNAVYRDTAWYHVMVVKVDNSTVKLYVNGEEITDLSSSTNNGAQSTWWNVASQKMYIGGYINTSTAAGHSCESVMSQFYFISGKAVSPSEFGFTDPLTNTWRPKSFSAFNNPNNGITWSNSPTVTGGSLSDTTDGFDGSITSSGDHCTLTATSSSAAANATFTASIPKVTKVEVFVHSASSSGDTRGTCLDTDGVTHTSASLKSASQSFHTIYEGDPITLVNIGWGINQNGATGTGSDAFRAFRVNGYILIDNGRDNSFYLPFDGSAAIGKDQSGNNKEDIEFTSVNFDGSNDVIPESPSGCSFSSNLSSGISGISTSQAPSGYCTWNPSQPVTNGAGNRTTYANGNLTGTTNNSWTTGGLGTIGVSSGKWYWEITSGAYTGGTGLEIGAAKDTLQWTISNSEGAGTSAGAYLYYNDGRKGNNNSASSYGSTYTDGDILGVALDLDAGTISFYKNGVSQGIAFTGLSGIFYPCFSDYNDSGTAACTANFGQSAFTFPVPLGHQPLNLANLPSPGVVIPASVVGVLTYRGNDATSHPITELKFNAVPDLVWIKNIDQDEKQIWHDTIRGVGNVLYTNSSDGADTGSTYSDRFPSFDHNGFTVGGTHTSTNSDGDDFVAYCWRAGGNPGISTSAFWTDAKEYASAATAGLDGGTITPDSASIGTKQGFSILKYRGNGVSGATLSHGLSQAPDFFIIKSTIYSYNWNVYHQAMGNTHLIRLNDTAAQVTESGAAWNDTSPTSSVITFGNLGGTNMNTAEYMAYIWHDVPGLQKFGSYDGNSANDGIFVNCGFEPALIIIKVMDGTNSWYLHDIARTPANPSNDYLNPNLTAAQTASSHPLDILSNGFKLRNGTYDGYNGNFNYIYAAWAHQPMNNLYGAQSNAR